jgi:cation diffusion facilitator family transporter
MDADRALLRLAAQSVAVAAVVLALKALAWAMSGSAALFSDAAESMVNVATAAGAYLALRYGMKPADARHPFGHHKAEYFSAVAIGALILLAATMILMEAWEALRRPGLREGAAPALAVNATAAVMNALWCRRLLRAGRRWGSPALTADGRHLLADVVTSAGVLAGVGAALATGELWLDPALAALVAASVLVSGFALLRASLGALMDEAVDDATLARVKATISAAAEGSLEAHDVRTRRAGRVVFLDFHLVVPAAMSVGEAHSICDRVEAALIAELEGARVTIHVEPEGKAKQEGVPVL